MAMITPLSSSHPPRGAINRSNRCPGWAVASRRHGGFTLVEILLSISISALILGSAATFLFATFNLFTTAENDPKLEFHKLGVAGFIQYAFSQALSGNSVAGGTAAANTTANATADLGGLNTAPTYATLVSLTVSTTTGGNTAGGAGGNSTAGGTGGNTTDDSSTPTAAAPAETPNVRLGWPPNVDATDNPYLTFNLDSTNPLLVWEQGPRPICVCWLMFKQGEGLELAWMPNVPTATTIYQQISTSPVLRTMLSPLVTKMEYVYYDPNSQTWNTSDEAPLAPTDATQTTSSTSTTGNTYVLPDYILLTFDLNGKIEKISIPVPPLEKGVPIF
jgi:prepilin-type N-terminal cleavage/methylation domain-containing protein